MERHLAAILVTDVVGYSRLIRADEEGTIAALKSLRADIINPKIAEHHGRIVKLMGDGMLAEFASVVDAVRAAVETQQAVSDRNADVPADKRILVRDARYPRQDGTSSVIISNIVPRRFQDAHEAVAWRSR